MSWMKSTYHAYYGHKDINSDAVTTGKLKSQGGISGRTESTGLGVFYATKQLLSHPDVAKELKISPGIKGKSYVVQGFGNVGYWASKFFVQEGAKLIGVAEQDGGVYNQDGIDPEDLKKYLIQHKSIKGYPNAKFMEKD